MESLSIIFSSSLPSRTHSKTHKPTASKLTPHPLPTISAIKDPNFISPHSPSSINTLSLQNPPFLQHIPKTHLQLPLFQLLYSLPCLAAETVASPSVDQASDKINLESILVSIDDFFNRNPFFVAGCTFIWLVVVPVVEYYLSKCKYVSAIDAFRKLRDDPSAQLLDIRDRKSLAAMNSPDLKYLKKGAVQVQFDERSEDKFVKMVLERFSDAPNTILCVLDNFDGNSLKVAELLFKNGFKEVYAIKGGVRGKKGWLAIQESLLPPSVHMYPKKKVKGDAARGFGTNGVVGMGNNIKLEESPTLPKVENQTLETNHVSSNSTAVSTSSEQIVQRPSSPYPNYPDMKPPASPTPSKPRS